MAATAPMKGKTVLITGGTGGIGARRRSASPRWVQGSESRVETWGAWSVRRQIASESGSGTVDVFSPTCRRRPRCAGWPRRCWKRTRAWTSCSRRRRLWSDRHVTADGLEHTFALGDLAPFLLTSLLADRLIASVPSRVVTVSSHAQGWGRSTSMT